MSRVKGTVFVEESLLDRIQEAISTAGNHIESQRTPGGAWKGELSSSALSTATAIFALTLQAEADPSRAEELMPLVLRGAGWLVLHANPDGGWGDTVISPSNLSTTTLVWSALRKLETNGGVPRIADALGSADVWIQRKVGTTAPDDLARAIIARYGKDRTFSVPILTMAALAGSLGKGEEAWNRVIPLPFELAACPASWFAALKLPVVSYALPALIAIGLARHVNSPSTNPVVRFVRGRSVGRALQVLESIQPSNGGFLEATPLTSFVAMSLIGSGRAGLPVVRKCVDFLLSSIRADGSWAIDTDLEMWVTTLAVNAMGMSIWTGPNHGCPTPAERRAILQWILKAQYQEKHPYTQAAPGAWAWTTSPGGVPDADDTAGALIALRHLDPSGRHCLEPALNGVQWLLKLQNGDGGIPTFCRGWGNLPFDRSSPDITAHAIRAWAIWSDACDQDSRRILARRITRALGFLRRSQRPDGSWVPLWFGNDKAPDEENPTYGTARVVLALASLNPGRFPEVIPMMRRGIDWLHSVQHSSGGWGGAARLAPTVEETSLSIEALAMAAICIACNEAECEAGARAESLGLELKHSSELTTEALPLESLCRGFDWLFTQLKVDSWPAASPIGFYFAKLWYFEKLYPGVHCLAALNKLKLFAELFSKPQLDPQEDFRRLLDIDSNLPGDAGPTSADS